MTPHLLRELIDKIEVYETEGVGKNRTQRIVIYCKFIGYIELPENEDYEKVILNARKGVAINYLTSFSSSDSRPSRKISA